jgi:RNA polymerase sigma-70 factor (ECF subfamily)
VAAAGQTESLLEHLFRHQAGRIVAHLARVLGPSQLDLAEESAQEAMLRALQSWPYHGVPENAAGWLFTVARNHALDTLRRNARLAEETEAIPQLVVEPSEPELEEQLRDDELRMLFMCCHPEFSRDISVTLSLKTVGGFSVQEIARGLLADEAAVAQRLVRAKRQIRGGRITLEMPGPAVLSVRLDSVLEVIYLMFNEGYAAHDGEELIRDDLCREALRLARLLASSSMAVPRVHALTALLALQAARLPARLDNAGDLVLLEQQDRSRWDRRLIALGFEHLNRSMEGEEVSAYHAQAAIAATHVRANAAAGVDWPVILELYDQLVEIDPSPIVALNRAVAVARVHGPAEALALIEPLQIREYHLLLAVRGHLLADMGRRSEAAECFRAALDCPCSAPERRFLTRKLHECR